MIDLTGYIWRDDVVDKLAWKHNLTTDEVEEVFKISRVFTESRKAAITAKMYMLRGAERMPADI